MVSIRLRSVGPEKSWASRSDRLRQKFQSVSGLWDRRNKIDVSKAMANQVSIRLRSVGPEKYARPGSSRRGSRFQSVSGLWDRRNRVGQQLDVVVGGFNPSPVCGTGEMSESGYPRSPTLVSIRLRSVGPEKSWDRLAGRCRILFQSVSGLWDRRNPVQRRRPAP